MSGAISSRCHPARRIVLSCIVCFPIAAGCSQVRAVGTIDRCAHDVFRERVARIAPADADLDSILVTALSIKRLNGSALGELPFEVYEVQYTFARPSAVAIVLVRGKECRVVRGPSPDLADEPADEDAQRRAELDGINTFLVGTRDASKRPADLIRLAQGVVQLLFPEDGFTIVENDDALESLLRATPASSPGESIDSLLRKWRGHTRPQLDQGAATATVRFLSWRRFGGVLSQHTVAIDKDGTVDQSTEILAVGVGLFEAVRHRF